MSDEKLRELERRFKETGSVEDEAAWLKERVRVGDLTQERLELAAYCGHEGAKLLTQRQSRYHAARARHALDEGMLPTDQAPLDRLEAWTMGLELAGLRFVVVCAHHAADSLITHRTRSFEAGLRATSDWLEDPSSKAVAACTEACDSLLSEIEVEEEANRPISHLQAAWGAASAVCSNLPYDGCQGIVAVARYLAEHELDEANACRAVHESAASRGATEGLWRPLAS